MVPRIDRPSARRVPKSIFVGFGLGLVCIALDGPLWLGLGLIVASVLAFMWLSPAEGSAEGGTDSNYWDTGPGGGDGGGDGSGGSE